MIEIDEPDYRLEDYKTNIEVWRSVVQDLIEYVPGKTHSDRIKLCIEKYKEWADNYKEKSE